MQLGDGVDSALRDSQHHGAKDVSQPWIVLVCESPVEWSVARLDSRCAFELPYAVNFHVHGERLRVVDEEQLVETW